MKDFILLQWKQILLFIVALYFIHLMVLITLQYVPIDFQAAFLNIKQDEIRLKHYQWAFFIHVYTSIFVLLAGLTQFSSRIRTRYRKIHRYSGFFYVFTLLILSSPSGFVMGLYANGGFISQLSFCILAILWFYFTVKAFQKALKGDFKAHRAFMYRSYALTLSAITLRLWKWILVALFEPAPMDTYRIVAWIGWVLNLLVVEWYLIYSKKTI